MKFLCNFFLPLVALGLLWAGQAWAVNYSGKGGAWYWKTSGDQGEYFSSNTPGTRAGIQTVIDYSTPTNKVNIQLGPGTYDLDSTLWLHGNLSIRGIGKGITTLRRSRFSASDPFNHGNIICSAKYGQHTPNSGQDGTGAPTDSLASIEISDLTIDGNYTSWPSVDPNGCANFGIRIYYTDGVVLRNVEVKNTLQTAIEVNGCRNVQMSSIKINDVGKQLNLGTRNGINFNDNASLVGTKTKRWGENHTLTDFQITNQKDAAIDCANVSGVSIENGQMYCDHDTTFGNFAFEFEGSLPFTMRGFKINNVHAVGLTGGFFTNGLSAGTNLDEVTITNCSSVFSVAKMVYTAMNIKSSSNSSVVTNFKLANSRFSNCNSGNNDGSVYTAGFVWATGGTGGYSSHINVSDCVFEGAQGSVLHASNDGVRIGGRVFDVNFRNVYLKNAEAHGFNIVAGAADTTYEVRLENCFVDGAQDRAYIVETAGGLVSGVTIKGCTGKDAMKNAAGCSFQALTYASGQRLKNIRFEGNRLFRTSGTNMQGMQLANFAAGSTIDSVWVINNDMNRAASNPYLVTSTGTVSNVFWSDPAATMSPARLGPYSSPTTGGALRIVDGVTFPITVIGTQAAIDECYATGGGTVMVPANANMLLGTTPVVLKNKVALVAFGQKTHDNGSVFTANASTNVKFAIVSGDTAAGQQLFQLDGITIDGNKSSGARVDAGIYSKLNFVGSRIDNCRVAFTSGKGIVVAGAAGQAAGSFLIRNTIVNDTGDYNIDIVTAARNVTLDHVEMDRPGRNTAALHIAGESSGAGILGVTGRSLYFEVQDSMSACVLIDGASNVDLDQVIALHPSGRFRTAVLVKNSGPGNFGFSPSGLTVRDLYSVSDTLIEDQQASLVFTTGADVNNPYRHIGWYSSPKAVGSASTNGYRNSTMLVGVAGAKLGPDIASATTIAPHPDGTKFLVTGTTTSTDVTFLDSFVGQTITFRTAAAWQITSGNHWKLNGNFVGNATGNDDTITGYVDGSKNFIEMGRSLN